MDILKKLSKITVKIIVIILILIALFFSIKWIVKQKAEIRRLTNNFENIDFQKDSLLTANNKLIYKVSSLELKKSELKKFNEALVDDIKEMEVKLKNVSSSTKIEYVIKYVQQPAEIIYVDRISDSTFYASINNEWLNFYEAIEIYEDSINHVLDIDITEFELEVHDNLHIVNEELTKGWWFWKRIVGVDVHIKSDNPYFQLNKVESIRLKH